MEKIGKKSSLLESPIYSARWNAVFYVDINLGRIFKFDISTATFEEFSTPQNQMIGCIAETDQGTIIAAIENGVYELDVASAAFTQLCDFEGTNIPKAHRPNDGIAGPDGALYFGTMSKANNGDWGSMYRFATGDGLTEIPSVGQFRTVNGMAFSNDARTVYIADSFRTERRVWIADFEAATGSMSNKRPFLDMGAMIEKGQISGRPDGAIIDLAGNYWVCGVDGAAIYQFSPNGSLLASVAVPGVSKPTKIVFDSAGMMYLTTIAIDGEPDSGFLFQHQLPTVTTMVHRLFRMGARPR